MLGTLVIKQLDFDNVDPMPLLSAATDRLRRYAKQDQASLPPDAQRLLDEAMSAAAEAEQRMAMQRARIRYLEGLSITDELTSALNRRGFDTELERALARAERQGETGVLLLCDLDRFKAVNDTYGHAAGDRVLKSVVRLMRTMTRASDYVARLGGDEFGLLFTLTDMKRAARRCQGIIAAVNSHLVEWENHSIPVTASFGLAPYGPGTKSESLLVLADSDLYGNKNPPTAATAAR